MQTGECLNIDALRQYAVQTAFRNVANPMATVRPAGKLWTVAGSTQFVCAPAVKASGFVTGYASKGKLTQQSGSQTIERLLQIGSKSAYVAVFQATSSDFEAKFADFA